MTAQSQAKLGYLAELKRGNGNSPQTFSLIAEVTDVPEIGAESNLVEVTHTQSPNGALEYISGMDDGMELPVVCNLRLDHASQSPSLGLIYDQQHKVRRDFTLGHPDWGGIVVHFTALVKGFKMALPTKDAQKATFTLKITGGLVFGT